jgi:hypothetical protein
MVTIQECRLTTVDFEDILAANGFIRNCEDWHEYERGKKIINTLATSPAEYDAMISTLVDFLQV